jgi:hypothetical protein
MRMSCADSESDADVDPSQEMGDPTREPSEVRENSIYDHQQEQALSRRLLACNI